MDEPRQSTLTAGRSAPILALVLAGALAACQPSAGTSPSPGVGDAPPSDGRYEALLDDALERFDGSAEDLSRAWADELVASIASEAASGGCVGCTELAIVERMLELPQSGQLTFEQAARFAVADLTRGELYEERS